MKTKIKSQNYLGMNHDRVKERFEGKPTYIQDGVVKGDKGMVPAAIYHCDNPNRAKGHKEFMILVNLLNPETMEKQFFVMGLEKKDLRTKFEGILCKACNTALYSLSNHNFHSCGCENETFVDGGLEYLRYGAMDMNKVEAVTIDILKGTVRKKRKATVRE